MNMESPMKAFLIGYDLNRPARDYDNLFKAIRQLGTWWHYFDSTWIVKSNCSAQEIRDRLVPHIDGNDDLLVVLLTREAAWTGFDSVCTNWLTTNLGRTS
jgi:hypothetical protein